MYKDELAIISQAILNEVEGREFYLMASAQSASKGTKEAFLELADEERKHEEYLKKLWNELSGESEFNIESILESGIEIPSPEIYNWGKVDKDNISSTMSVFSIGMQMEQESVAFYENVKSKVSSRASKELFDLLIKWENVHLTQFNEQYKLLKEEWWSYQDFAPF
nr:ferritin family protein [Sedimentibacter sp.]